MSATPEKDPEKHEEQVEVVSDGGVAEIGQSWSRRLITLGVETRGIMPVPIEKRTDTQFYKIFFIWFSCNVNILSFSAGTLGPVVFGMGVRDACLVIFFFNLLCCIPPAYFATWGPKLGLRQMVQSRFSFGYYGAIVPCIFNLIGMFGFTILNCIVGGQALASVADGSLSWGVGIAITVIISLFVSFCGYTVLNWYERIAWMPVIVVFVIALGLSGRHIENVPSPEPVTAPVVLTFASTIAGFVITYSGLASDFTNYFKSDVPSWRIFLYSYLGFTTSLIPLQCLGAAVSASAFSVPDWEAGFEDGSNVGGLLLAMLRPVGNFGKFLTVLLSLSVAGNIAATFYSISLNIQVFIPALVIVPRYVFSIMATAIVLPLAIAGSHRFYETLVNFLGLISYWAAAYIGIILVEHLYFRRNDPNNYDISAWNAPKRLPWGFAALTAGICSFGLVIPSMEQTWFVGPIAETTGDIGFEMAFAVSALLYMPLRSLEIKLRKAM